MLFVYFSTLLESILKSGLLPSALLAGENWVGIVGVGIVGVGIIAPTQVNDLLKINKGVKKAPKFWILRKLKWYRVAKQITKRQGLKLSEF